MFLCALEPRIQAAVVVEGNTENLAGADYQPPGAYADAEQNLIGGLSVPLDRGDLLWAFAPKPLLICYTPIDNGSTYSPTYVRGTEEIFYELRAVYAVHQAQTKVALSSSPLPHEYDYFQRRSTYEWFGKCFLSRSLDAEEAEFDDARESSLWCTSTGQVLTSLRGRAAFEVNRDRLQILNERRGVTDKKRVQAGLTELLNIRVETQPPSGMSLAIKRQRNVIVEELEYRSEPGIRVPGWFLKPATGGPRFPVAVVLQDGGRDEIFDRWPIMDSIIGLGAGIFSIDVRTRGITTPRLPPAGPEFYGQEVTLAYSMVNLCIGTPIIGQQIFDLLRGLDHLANRNDVDPSRVGLFGTGATGLVCLMAAALNERVRSVMLNRTLVDFASIVASKDYDLPLSAVAFGFLQKFDLPEICSTLAPRPVWLVNSTGPQANVLRISAVREKYKIAADAYAQANERDRLAFRVEPRPIHRLVAEWVKSALVR